MEYRDLRVAMGVLTTMLIKGASAACQYLATCVLTKCTVTAQTLDT